VKRCASCGRDIPESATVCDTCQKWASDYSAPPVTGSDPFAAPHPSPVVSAPASPSAASAPAAVAATPSATTAVAKKPALTRRQLTLIGAGIVGVGVIAAAAIPALSGPSTAVAPSGVAPAARKATTPAPISAPPRATQAWSTTRRGYWTANQRHAAAFELPAENTVPIWMNYVRPLLVVRCMGKKAETFVYTGSALKIEPETEEIGRAHV